MKKIKLSNKVVKESFDNIKSAPYCGLQYLLSYKEPLAYTSGVYGWNYDVYMLDGLTICTGYRNMLGEKAKDVEKFENKARDVVNSNRSYNEKKEMIEHLLEQFIELNR